MSRASIRRATRSSDLGRLMREAAGRHHLWDVFSDFCEMAALAVANSVDLAQRERREARYMDRIRRYEPAEQALFPQMLAALVERLEEGPADVLGALFGELELGNADRGQFFTPFEVCRLMARMQIGDGRLPELLEQRGFITVNEPACGAGAMVIAFAEAMQEAGYNPQRQLHITCQDVDSRGVHMAFLQLSLLHIPAIVVLGNTLTLETREVWYTPAHILGGWSWKLGRGRHPLIEPANDNTPSETKPPEPETKPAEPETPVPETVTPVPIDVTLPPLGEQFGLF